MGNRCRLRTAVGVVILDYVRTTLPFFLFGLRDFPHQGYMYMYIIMLSGSWKRWGSFQRVPVEYTHAQRKRFGNVDGNAFETSTET